MTTLTITVKPRTAKGATGVEGTYQLSNSTTAKLARKDGSTLFPNRGSLSQAAQRLATTLGWTASLVEPQKKAAKKSVKKATSNKATPAKAPAAKKATPKKTAKSSKTTCSTTAQSCPKTA